MKLIDRLASDAWWEQVAVGGKKVPHALRMDPYNSPVQAWERIVAMRINYGLDQAGPAWHDFRKAGVGSSDVPVIMRQTPYGSVQDTFRQKAGHTTGRVSSYDNAHTARGKLWEPVVRDWYQRFYGWPMTPVCVEHDTVPWARASLDGLRDDHAHVLEIKCPTTQNFERVRAAGRPTDAYLAQVAYQLWVTGAASAHVVVFDAERPMLPAGDRTLVYPVERDPLFEAAMVDRLTEFWGFVERQEPPPRGW